MIPHRQYLVVVDTVAGDAQGNSDPHWVRQAALEIRKILRSGFLFVEEMVTLRDLFRDQSRTTDSDYLEYWTVDQVHC